MLEQLASAALAEVSALIDVAIDGLDASEETSALVDRCLVDRSDVRKREQRLAVRLDARRERSVGRSRGRAERR
jgi:hypothetical protein